MSDTVSWVSSTKANTIGRPDLRQVWQNKIVQNPLKAGSWSALHILRNGLVRSKCAWSVCKLAWSVYKLAMVELWLKCVLQSFTKEMQMDSFIFLEPRVKVMWPWVNSNKHHVLKNHFPEASSKNVKSLNILRSLSAWQVWEIVKPRILHALQCIFCFPSEQVIENYTHFNSNYLILLEVTQQQELIQFFVQWPKVMFIWPKIKVKLQYVSWFTWGRKSDSLGGMLFLMLQWAQVGYKWVKTLVYVDRRAQFSSPCWWRHQWMFVMGHYSLWKNLLCRPSVCIYFLPLISFFPESGFNPLPASMFSQLKMMSLSELLMSPLTGQMLLG